MSKLRRRDFVAGGSLLAGSLLAGSLLSRRQAVANQVKPRIKVGQIGTSHAHAAGKLATLRKLSSDFEVVGIVETDPKRRTAAMNVSAYRDLKWMTEEQLLNSPGLQAVAVETAVPDLVPTAARCVDAGLHIHLDKPAGSSLSAFRTLLQKADAAELAVQMGYMFRNNPAFTFCFKAVREGWLGDLFEIDTVMSKRVGDERRDALRQVPGGTMFELGCHLIDAIIAILGPAQKVTPFIRQTRMQRDDLQDNMLAVLGYPQATCTVRSSVVEVEGQRRRQFVVCGTSGTIEIRPLEPPKLSLTLDKPHAGFSRGFQQVDLPKMSGRYDDQLQELASVIRGEKKIPYSSRHDLAVHEAILLASGLPIGD